MQAFQALPGFAQRRVRRVLAIVGIPGQPDAVPKEVIPEDRDVLQIERVSFLQRTEEGLLLRLPALRPYSCP